jgi:hypothetical protein
MEGREERTNEQEIYNPTPFFEPSAQESLLSFNYTLIQQGFASQVSCIYDRTSPLRFKRVRTRSDSTVLPVLQYGGSCNATEGRDQTPNVDMPFYTIEGTKNTLISWVCQVNSEEDPSYAVVYLQLVSATPVNITCTVWQMHPENYSVTYISSLDYYTTKTLVQSENVYENGAPQSTSGTSLHYGYMSYAIDGLSSLISRAQNGDSNLFVDSIESLTSTSRELQYSGDLILYQGMIQGILDYKVRLDDLNSTRD